VRAKRKDLEANKRLKTMFAYDPRNKKTVVVVGGGSAGASCIMNLRQEGFTGRIILICKENILPYDRVKVSKNFGFDIDKALLRTPAFYDEHNIEVKLGVKAVGNEGMPIAQRLNRIIIFALYSIVTLSFTLRLFRCRSEYGSQSRQTGQQGRIEI